MYDNEIPKNSPSIPNPLKKTKKIEVKSIKKTWIIFTETNYKAFSWNLKRVEKIACKL